jgi:hypothetical protein
MFLAYASTWSPSSLVAALRTADQAALRAALRVLRMEDAAAAWGVPYTERGIVASVVYDTQGVHLPAKRVMREGGWVWERRKHIAYISNLVVASGARRCASRVALAICSAH